MTPGARRGLAYLFVLVLLIIGGAYYQSARSVSRVSAEQHRLNVQQHNLAVQERRLHQEVLTQCRWYGDVGNLAAAPVALNPRTHQASKIGIGAVADSRVAWRGLGCPGTLRPPGASFRHWARVFHLSAR